VTKTVAIAAGAVWLTWARGTGQRLPPGRGFWNITKRGGEP
jgi:hypothetical protein